MLPNSLRKILCVACAVLMAAILVDGKAVSFEKQVAPLLKKYCIECHGPDEQENGVRVDTMDLDFLYGKHRDTWHDILDVLHLEDMPPEDEPQPEMKERQLMIDWITAEMTRAAEIKRSTDGMGVLRRLTRYEYQNTMTDLLGFELDYAANLPPESNSHDGFKNNGLIMGMSSMQLEYYLEAAQRGLAKVLVDHPQPERFEHFGSHNVARSPRDKDTKSNTRNIQPGNSFWTRMLEYPVEGPFRIRVKAHAVIPEGKGPPRMRIRIGLRPDTYVTGGQVGEDIDVFATADNPRIYEFNGYLDHYPVLESPANFPGLLVNVHNIYDDGSDAIEVYDLRIGDQFRTLNDPDPKQPWLVVDSIEFVANDHEIWPPAYHRGILFKGAEVPENENAYAREVFERFMARAYRRPPNEEEVDQVFDFYKKVRPIYPSFVESIRQALSMVLISPQFLYLMEPLENEKASRDLNAYEVASRLSYFLWSTMPDDELSDLASSGKLLRSSVLKKQVRRMLKDKRSERFVEQFTDQWLDLQALDRVAVNPQFYPDFKDRAKDAMRLESQAFFKEILYNDLSALNFIESDFAMLNERLAKHYGIEGVVGMEMTRVPLKPEDRRGGLITQGSMLVGNSTGEDSHPIERAVWILERLLDDPPSPPPANVPALDPETPGFSEMSLKDQLGVHRDVPSCVNCHLKIDPWGIPLEHYDATGLYRTEAIRLTAGSKGEARNKIKMAPLDAKDSMPDGHVIDGAQELKAYLLKEKEAEFARAMVVKLTAYALGRSLEFTDEENVDRLAKEFKKHDYQLDDLIEAIVTSELFLTR